MDSVIIDKYELYHGDCLEVMQSLPDNSIDMVLCDLPYQMTACKWDVLIPFDKLWESYKRVCKKDAAILLFGSMPFSAMNLSLYFLMASQNIIQLCRKEAKQGWKEQIINNNITQKHIFMAMDLRNKCL